MRGCSGITSETGTIPAFKKGSIPPEACNEVSYTKEYSAKDAEGKLIPESLCIHESIAKTLAGKNVLVVDDVAATGGTLCAAVKLMQAGGATVIAACCITCITPLLPQSLAALYALQVPLLVLAP